MRDDSGVVAVVVAICLVVFVLFSVLVVDVGYWYNVRRQLQASADAAALAGCHELILDKTDAEIWRTVMEYVGHNTVTPADTTITVVPPSAGGPSDIGDDFVKVTVERDTRSFFAAVLGVAQTPIVAQARAEIAFATEGRGLVPFSVPIVLPGEETEVIAHIGGGEESLPQLDENEYGGDVSFASNPAAGKAYSFPVYVEVFNSLGTLAEDFDGAAVARVLVRDAAFPITDVSWEDRATGAEVGFVPPGAETRLRITTSEDKAPNVKIDNHNVAVVSDGASGGSYFWHVDYTVPTNVERYDMHEATVSLKIGNKTYQFNNPAHPAQAAPAAVLVAVRSNAPISDVVAAPLVFTGGGFHTVDVWVEFLRYEISVDAGGPEYALMVDDGGGAEAGNFGTVDFRTVVAPDWPPYDNERDYDGRLISGNWYSFSLENGWVGDVMIGDAILTYTGISGGATENGLEDRFGDDTMTFAQWLDAGKPASPRLLYVPVVEKIEEVAGRSWVAVVDFAAFYVESYDKSEDLITGHFIQYIGASGGSSGSGGPSGLYLETPHLVSEDIDF